MPRAQNTPSTRAIEDATHAVATKFGEVLNKEDEDATVLEAVTIEVNKYAVDALTLLGIDYSPEAVTAILLLIAGRGPALGGAVRWAEYQADFEGSPSSLLRLRQSLDELDLDEEEG